MAGIQVLVLKHDTGDPAGLLGKILDEHGVSYHEVDAEREELPENDYQALLILGGPQYANDDLPYLVAEKALLRRMLERSIPVLGMCLGGQLLASVCGAEVRRWGDTEIGFYQVQLTAEGKRDPLFAGFPGEQHQVFQWHNDTFDLPPGAVLLETGTTTRQQAFRWGQHAYGMQYHPELTDELLHLWLRLIRAEETDNLHKHQLHGHISDAEVAHSFPIYQQHTRIIFTNFLKLSGLIS